MRELVAKYSAAGRCLPSFRARRPNASLGDGEPASKRRFGLEIEVPLQVTANGGPIAYERAKKLVERALAKFQGRNWDWEQDAANLELVMIEPLAADRVSETVGILEELSKLGFVGVEDVAPAALARQDESAIAPGIHVNVETEPAQVGSLVDLLLLYDNDREAVLGHFKPARSRLPYLGRYPEAFYDALERIPPTSTPPAARAALQEAFRAHASEEAHGKTAKYADVNVLHPIGLGREREKGRQAVEFRLFDTRLRGEPARAALEEAIAFGYAFVAYSEAESLVAQGLEPVPTRCSAP